ncbi:MFS transporter [Microbispora amethystogenes]|uniref:MFS transporter n=1 Tax=Microbispora amethystogenes TaxID=1427754 RepID=UPI00340F62FE
MSDAHLINGTRDDGRVAGARRAVIAAFAVNGAVIATISVRTPSLKLDHGLAEGSLGLLSALFGVAALAAMQLAGRLAARTGSAWLVRAASAALPLALLGVGLAHETGWLAAAMLAAGALNGLLDVGMNAHAVTVERMAHRPIMSGCHAAWSIGAVAGSLAGGAAAQVGMSLAGHFAALAALVTPTALVASRWLLPAAADRGSLRSADDRSVPRERRAGWTRRVVLLGGLGAAVLTCEGAVITWSGVYLHESRGASLGAAALGFIAFTACQTAGRLAGDRLAERHPARVLVRAGAGTAAVGLVAVVVAPWPILAIIGFALMGVGLATPLPLIYSAAGHAGAGKDGAGAVAAVARFTTMTYAGILLAPPLIGRVAQVLGLTWTLALLVPLLVTVAWAAPAAMRTPSRSVAASSAGRPGESGATTAV